MNVTTDAHVPFSQAWTKMAAGVSDRLWEIDDIVALVEANDPKPVRRGPYKKAEISK
jgi:hypothetical protein